MFYKIIEKKRDEWLNSPGCVVADLVSYIKRQHKMRDAQIEAIKTYLFLKIECKNMPLWKLIASGKLNTTDVDEIEVNQATRVVLRSNPAALALWEYASIADENGNVNSPKIIDAIKRTPKAIDYDKVLKDLFFNVSYTDYLFSIPMGAGKTYLMAAFIYLNLYFALSEPDNPLFAHNFILLVPSGLKSSIIPSLRDIQNFNPLWILPDPAATQLKNTIKYEWLQEASAASKSNLVQNPNARKISMHTATPDLTGLVAVTNAEKVILDRVENENSTNKQFLQSLSDAERKEQEAAKQANELREQIGKIPGLCIMIDEVHHASEGQKLRQVVNKWMEQSNLNSVLGFSGTPNMDPAMRINVAEDLYVKCSQYANVVTYYPLIDGVGNFLKIPTVRYSNMVSSEVIKNGLHDFFERYSDTRYSNGTFAKIAIYAPSIAALEEEIYPEASKFCVESGLNPAETILKYHKGNSTYKQAEDAQLEFSMLDFPQSKKRIILLVGIGREGWNCKSLTGVILSQRNACPQNMVLQISCRCLREVDNAKRETALIWLNKFNADKLNKQLQEQQYTTISEFGGKKPQNMIQRHSRMKTVKLPAIDFYQIQINYTTVDSEKQINIGEYLSAYKPPQADAAIIYTQGFDSENTVSESADLLVEPEKANFRLWLDLIIKESFGSFCIQELIKYEKELSAVFDKITVCEGDTRIFRPNVDQSKVRADIRTCFVPKRTLKVATDAVPAQASLCDEQKLKLPVEASAKDIYVPNQERVNVILKADNAQNIPITEEIRAYLLAIGRPSPEEEASINRRTYHYLPYHLDSNLEKEYIDEVISLLKTEEMANVEFYYNGDDTLTDFYITCYTKRGGIWKRLPNYYPDFLLLTRKDENTIDKLVIVETKGEVFADKFEPRKDFMKDLFLKINNEKFGRDRFDFLYIEGKGKDQGNGDKEKRIQDTINKIKSFLLS